jgi:MoaA/NifB/PqqE/SkfB family radical SAM enzyme
MISKGRPKADPPELKARVGKDGRLVLPAGIVRRLGLVPGSEVPIAAEAGRVEILPNIHSLSRLYIEPTSRCNLACTTCIRNTWKEPLGDMDWEVFERLAGQIGRFEHLESVMFGGFGEPTGHVRIVDMVGAVKALGLRAEMVTNGTLLDEALLGALHEARLDTLWVSFDGFIEEVFEEIRRGANFRRVVENLQALKAMNAKSGHAVEVGLAFVVMKKNVNNLAHLNEIVELTGARQVSVSNVLPYTPDMEKEMVCRLTLALDTFSDAPGKPAVSLPRLDFSPITRDALLSLFWGYANLDMMGNSISARTGNCRFIKDRTTFVRWDGKVAPCMGLLHSYTTTLHSSDRTIESYIVGDVAAGDLFDIWNSEEYRAFREKVNAFDFAPCHLCGGCTLLETNKEDCFGNGFPACGGCLWAHGVIQCP